MLYVKSPTVQDAFWPIPGLISCAGVTRSNCIQPCCNPVLQFLDQAPQLLFFRLCSYSWKAMSIPVELAKIQTGDADRLRVTEPFLSLCAAIT